MIDFSKDYVFLTPKAIELYQSINGEEGFGCIKPLLKAEESDYKNFPGELELTNEQLAAASYAMYHNWLICGDNSIHKMKLESFIINLVEHTNFSKEYAVAIFPDLKIGQNVKWMHGKQQREATVLKVENDRVYISGKNKDYWVKKINLIPKIKQ